VIEGLPEGRWAMISKVHHCMVDGISGTDLMAVLLDPDRSTRKRAVKPWTPEPEPSDWQLTLDALSGLAVKPVRRVLQLRPADLGAKQAWARLGEVVGGLRSLGTRILVPTKPVSVEGLIGPHRRWAAARCALDDAKTIRSAFGGSVNDVILAAVTGAFRTVLIERGDPVGDDTVVRSLVPVSVRQPGDHTSNNQVSLMIAELPVGIADPLDRLEAIRNQMTALKSSHQIAAGAAVVATAAFLPPVMLVLGARAAMSVLRKVPQYSVNTVTTNVPGPQYPLFALGREMLEYLPFVPLSEGIRIGVAILSYNGQITFGVTGDYDTAPDVHFMAEQIEAEMTGLRKRARRGTLTSSGRAHG
jgi:diacylglycerol O-acyltransferase